MSFLGGFGHEAVFAPKGLSNGAVLTAAVSEARVLLTHDSDFAARPPLISHSGIVLLKIVPVELAQLKTALQRLLAQRTSPEGFTDQLIVLFPDRHEAFPFRAESIPE